MSEHSVQVKGVLEIRGRIESWIDSLRGIKHCCICKEYISLIKSIYQHQWYQQRHTSAVNAVTLNLSEHFQNLNSSLAGFNLFRLIPTNFQTLEYS